MTGAAPFAARSTNSLSDAWRAAIVLASSPGRLTRIACEKLAPLLE
jgi:hypothetical protein